MKVYRGPGSTHVPDDSHELVAEIGPAKLEQHVRSQTSMRFNITKDGTERLSVCTLELDDADVLAMQAGLLSRLRAYETCLAKVRAIVRGVEANDDDPIFRIQVALSLADNATR